MRLAAVILIAAMAAAGPASSQPPSSLGLEPAYRPQQQPDANDGRFIAFGGIFGDLRLGCVQCHGMSGAGNSSGAFPRLSGQGAWYLYKSLRDYAAGVRPNAIMGPIAEQLADQQMQNVAAYYASIQDAPTFEEPQADLQTLQVGGAIAATGIADRGVPACNGCHGTASVTSSPIYPYLAGQFASYMQNQLMLWKNGRRDGDAMNIMEMIAKGMTDEQIRAVSLYYASVRPGENFAGGNQPPNQRGSAPDISTSSTSPANRTGAQPPYLPPADARNRPNRTTTTFTTPPANEQ
jgi:cytochrome c553